MTTNPPSPRTPPRPTTEYWVEVLHPYDRVWGRLYGFKSKRKAIQGWRWRMRRIHHCQGRLVSVKTTRMVLKLEPRRGKRGTRIKDVNLKRYRVVHIPPSSRPIRLWGDKGKSRSHHRQTPTDKPSVGSKTCLEATRSRSKSGGCQFSKVLCLAEWTKVLDHSNQKLDELANLIKQNMGVGRTSETDCTRGSSEPKCKHERIGSTPIECNFPWPQHDIRYECVECGKVMGYASQGYGFSATQKCPSKPGQP